MSEEDNEDGCFEDWVDDEEMEHVYSLFGQLQCRSSAEALEHDRQQYNFDLSQLKKKLNLDLYGLIKVVNYVRRCVIQNGGPSSSTPELASSIVNDMITIKDLLRGDTLLVPVLENDALLFSLDELAFDEDSDFDSDTSQHSTSESKGGGEPFTILDDTERDARALLSVARASGLSHEEILEIEHEKLRDEIIELKRQAQESTTLIKQLMGEETAEADDGLEVDNDTYYFNSYARMDIHETMLRDTVRTGAYENAISRNPDLFRGKVVLDVGCGTGILSMFAARAGAKMVIGVDRSDIILEGRKLVAANGYSEVVSLLQGKMETIKMPVKQVDVIISEWMGYCLFYETMLPSVLYARDTYLAPGGTILPNKSLLYIEGALDLEDRLGWWGNVHGLDFTHMQPLMLEEAGLDVILPESACTSRSLVKEFDSTTLKDEDLDFEAPFSLTATKDGTVAMFCISFDIGFTHKCHKSTSVWFSTGPQSTPTHWKQTLLWLNPRARPTLKVGDTINGSLTLRRNADNHRELDLSVVWKATNSATGSSTYQSEQQFKVC